MTFWYYRIRFWLSRHLEWTPTPTPPIPERISTLALQYTELAEKRKEIAELQEKVRIQKANSAYIHNRPSNQATTVEECDREIAHLRYCHECVDTGIEIVPFAPTGSLYSQNALGLQKEFSTLFSSPEKIFPRDNSYDN